MSVTQQQVLDSLAKVMSPRGVALTDAGVLSAISVSDGKVFCSINVDATEARAWESVRAQAEADILSAQTSYVAALTRWQQYRDELVGKSSTVRETVAYAYRKGGASLIDLLSAERNENEVRLAAAQAAADVANAAASLKAATNAYTPTKKSS